MKRVRSRAATFVLVALLAIGAGTASRSREALAQQPGPTMKVHFIDVGQGDAILVEFPMGAMLIDAGGDSDEDATKPAVVKYVEGFLQQKAREANNRITKIDLLVLSHPHLDHTQYLDELDGAQDGSVQIDRYLDNGGETGSGSKAQKWIHKKAPSKWKAVTLSDIEQANAGRPSSSRTGLTNDFIDPFQDAQSDPRVQVLWATPATKPQGWTASEFKDQNNRSVVLRVDFGESSFLFPGDLEDVGIEAMVDFYAGSSALDVDVLKVGHHGSHNGTTDRELDATSPECAVISCGKFDDGKDNDEQFSTWAYGHPRRTTLGLLSLGMTKLRPDPKWALAADGPRAFRWFRVRKNIYATGWDGNVVVEASLHGITEGPDKAAHA